MKTPKLYKVKLNGIALYDCETIEHARDMVQGVRILDINPALFLDNDKLEKILSKKSYTITINKGNKILKRYNLGKFQSIIDRLAFHRQVMSCLDKKRGLNDTRDSN